MTTRTVLLAALLSLSVGCKSKSDAPPPAPAAKPVEGSAAAKPPAAPVFAGDPVALASGTIAAYDAGKHELAIVGREDGSEVYFGIHRYDVSGSATPKELVAVKLGDPGATPADSAKTYAAKLGKELAASTPLTGVPVAAGKATLPGGATVDFDTTAGALTVTIDGKPTTHKLDGGGVTTVLPEMAFAIPDSKLVAVVVSYRGDAVLTHGLELFGGAPTAGIEDALDKAAEDRLRANDGCKSGDRHDCDGDGSPAGTDKDDNDPSVK